MRLLPSTWTGLSLAVSLIFLPTNASKVCGLSPTPVLFNPFFTLFHPLMGRTKTYCVKLRQLFAGKTSVFADWKTGLKHTWVPMALVSGMTFLSFNQIFYHLVTAALYKYPQDLLHILNTVHP